MLQVSAQGVDFKVGRHFGEGQRLHVTVSHHYDVLGKRLVLDSTDRENHFLSRFKTVAIHNVRQNEGKLGAVRAINNSKPLRVNFLDDSYHFVTSPRARLFSFSISLGRRLSKELPYSLFFPACWPESDQGANVKRR